MLPRWQQTLVAIVFITGTTASFDFCPGANAGQYRKADVDAAVSDLGNEDSTIVKGAAYRLTEMGPEARAAVPKLIEVLQSGASGIVKGEVCKALGNMGADAEAAVPAIISFLKDPTGGYDRAYAPTALGNIKCSADKAVPALIDAVKSDEEPVVRQLAARALGDFGADATSAIPALTQALKTGDKDMREAASDGLGKIPAAESDVNSLTELLSDEIDCVRAGAAKSLGLSGAKAASAVPQLIKLLDDKNDKVKEAAVIALGGVGPQAKAAVPALKTVSLNAILGFEAKEALKKIGDSN